MAAASASTEQVAEAEERVRRARQALQLALAMLERDRLLVHELKLRIAATEREIWNRRVELAHARLSLAQAGGAPPRVYSDVADALF